MHKYWILLDPITLNLKLIKIPSFSHWERDQVAVDSFHLVGHFQGFGTQRAALLSYWQLQHH